MARKVAADKHGDSGEDRVEEVECSDRADTDHIEQTAFDAQIGERLMQALEDPVCPSWLRLHVCHKPLVVLAAMDG